MPTDPKSRRAHLMGRFHQRPRKRAPIRRKRVYYRKNHKKLNVRRGNPIRETKTRSGEEVYDAFLTSVKGTEGIDQPNDVDGAHGGRLHFWPTAIGAAIGGIVRVIPLYSIMCMQQGITEDRMTGASCFVKYLKMKGRITWGAQSQSLTQACDLRIIHGFIKNSPNLNGRQSFRAVNPRNPEDWTALETIQWTYDELQPYFDSLADDLKFRPKRESNLRILGNRKLTPSLRQWTARQQTTDGTSGDTSIGTFPDTRFSCNFPMMRKVHYHEGATQFAPVTGTVGFPNEKMHFINTAQWTPFACLYAPQGASLLPSVDGEPGNLPGFQYNDQIWYQDP